MKVDPRGLFMFSLGVEALLSRNLENSLEDSHS